MERVVVEDKILRAYVLTKLILMYVNILLLNRNFYKNLSMSFIFSS